VDRDHFVGAFVQTYTVRTSPDGMVDLLQLYIVDENEIVRSALANRLAEDEAVVVVGHAGNPDFALREVTQSCPDVVLVEVKRKDGMGLEIIRRLSHLPDPPCLAVLTSYPSVWEQAAAHRAGACAYFLKDLQAAQLIAELARLG